MLLRLDKVSLSFGARPLLDQVSLQIDRSERIALVGRNGEGKSSLLRLILGEVEPEAGTLWLRPGARVAHLAQDITALSNETVAQIVTGGVPRAGAHDHEEWQVEQRVATLCSRLGLDPASRFDQLSGGWRRRALLARALIGQPEILLLDEPTNHLDVEAIEWLEQFLLEYAGAALFVSHDRAFINHLATRIVELDRGALTATLGDYETYRRHKAHRLEVEAAQQALFDKKLAQEEVWIRKGIEARRTRNEGRVRALYQLRRERRARRERTGQVQLQQHAAPESGSLVFDVAHLGLAYGDRTIIRDFSVRIMRGDRVGLVGPNGAGKSSLIKALLGQIEVSQGEVRSGTRLEVAYYDQERAQLKLDESVMQNVAGRNDQVIVNGQSQHVSSYLRDFLFRADQLNTPAGALSGGERNRLMLARLFSQPANLLVMDEPTNDLDIDTLELLEEYVSEFHGTLLLVSHDRAFLDNVVTELLVFEGAGVVREFVGGYSDWAQFREQQKGSEPPRRAVQTPQGVDRSPRQRRLSYKDQRELNSLPEQLERLEAQKQQLEAELSDTALYEGAPEHVQERLGRLRALTQALEAGYARWGELEALSGQTLKP
ncbi:MAG TPA: ATP-binding cassette domain-containing protein [Steroidobacteraceae bacterium]|nr:ATP-binding cassette domain-containing protein [Steroidobacteraceae bacterium]